MEGENNYEYQKSLNSHGEAEMNPKQNLQCPRCDSVDTKFSYLNIHKTSQPRYVCKNCKGLWTHGGKVRKKNKKRTNPSTDSSSSHGGPSYLSATASRNLRGVGRLYLTRPQQDPNEPQIEFVRVDRNSFSFTQGFSKVLNSNVASLEAQAVLPGQRKFD